MRTLWLATLATLLPLPAVARPVSLAPSALVDVHCSNQELGLALKQLVGKTGYNLFLTPGVTGRVTAELHQVPALHALGLLLKMQSTEYRYKIVGNTVMVGNPEKLRKIPDNIFDRR